MISAESAKILSSKGDRTKTYELQCVLGDILQACWDEKTHCIIGHKLEGHTIDVLIDFGYEIIEKCKYTPNNSASHKVIIKWDDVE